MGKGSPHLPYRGRRTRWPKVREYAAAHPGVLLDAAGNVKDTGVLAVIPKGDVLRGVFDKDSYGLDELKGYTVLHEEIGLNGTEITNAQVGRDPLTGQPTVNFILTPAGGETFYKLTTRQRRESGWPSRWTTRSRRRRPSRSPSATRSGSTGSRVDEAQDLALTLRTGSLPVPLEITSQQAIGASLGQDAISQGIKASVIGIGLVMMFMLAVLPPRGTQRGDLRSSCTCTSTWPSSPCSGSRSRCAAIAGLVLTIGMAVDANVLIFERMKEESRLGKTTQAVVSHGFSRAFSAILDSNVTTIIAALVLTQLGKGSIQGFAVTLLIGNLATLFAAVFVSRLIFDFELDVLRAKEDPAHLEKDRMKRVIQLFPRPLLVLRVLRAADPHRHRGVHRQPRAEPRRGLQGRHRVPVPGGPGQLHRAVHGAGQGGDLHPRGRAGPDLSRRHHLHRHQRQERQQEGLSRSGTRATRRVRTSTDAIPKQVPGVSVGDEGGSRRASPSELEPLPRPADITDGSVHHQPCPGTRAGSGNLHLGNASHSWPAWTASSPCRRSARP